MVSVAYEMTFTLDHVSRVSSVVLNGPAVQDQAVQKAKLSQTQQAQSPHRQTDDGNLSEGQPVAVRNMEAGDPKLSQTTVYPFWCAICSEGFVNVLVFNFSLFGIPPGLSPTRLTESQSTTEPTCTQA